MSISTYIQSETFLVRGVKYWKERQLEEDWTPPSPSSSTSSFFSITLPPPPLSHILCPRSQQVPMARYLRPFRVDFMERTSKNYRGLVARRAGEIVDVQQIL